MLSVEERPTELTQPHSISAEQLEWLGSLGDGASAKVYACKLGEQRYALKLAHPNARLDARSTFAQEARRLAWAASRTLPKLCGIGLLKSRLQKDSQLFEAGTPYLLLSLAEGEPLERLLTQKRQDLSLFWAVARDVSEALDDLHESGVAHGDVKPANIVVQKTAAGYSCTLVDLGLADDAGASRPQGGTLGYLAPETFQTNTQSDGRARDLYALGRCLLEIGAREARSEDQRDLSLEGIGARERVLVSALTENRAAARPSAKWVHQKAVANTSEPLRRERAQRRIEQSYLLLRRRELSYVDRGHQLNIALPGTAGNWLRKQAQLLEQVRKVLGVETQQTRTILASCNEHRQRRWLVSLIGAAGVDFPPLPKWSDDELSDRLLQLVERGELRSITYSALLAGEAVDSLCIGSPTDDLENDPTSLALKLGAEAADEGALQATEALFAEGKAPPAMCLAAARAFKRRHELARALSLLSRASSDIARLERAGILLRAPDYDAAEEELRLIDLEYATKDLRSNVFAMRARMALARGDAKSARQHLQQAEPNLATYEAVASSALVEGDFKAAREALERALGYPHDAEQRARIEALFAHLAQRQGDAEGALARFVAAASHAARARAMLEEATYLAGVASTASTLGRLETALQAAERSELLFAHLGRTQAAARAALAAAATYATANAQVEAREACERTLQLAREVKDQHCRAYAHLVLADICERGEALQHVERAQSLLDPADAADTLRLMSRRLRLGEHLETSLWQLDNRSKEQQTDLQLEWWAARAEAALKQEHSADSNVIAQQLSQLSHGKASPAALGPAMAFGAELARASGDGDLARKLFQSAAEALSRLNESTPPGLRLSLLQQPWVKLIRPPEQLAVAGEQARDLERLINGLGERERLKSLFDRVLDALVLWTGVERGLLLLRAPEGRLVPRAARNIARKDLNPLQVELSRSLAERAMALSECVVAVDAAGELPELHASVHALKLRSVLAVPLLARGEALGVVYLDDRIRRGAFGPKELAWVRLVATLAAVAISDARDQLALRRAARRAARAEKRLRETLAQRDAELEVTARELAATKENRFSYPDIVGESPQIRRMLTLLDRVTPSEVPVLIFGESGSGKELVARALARNGPRRERPFVSENCSAIPETLLESTLFGHVKGAFTGASRNRIGLFEAADGGTLFLDEIAEMSLGMQAKLLRALESGEIRRVGDERTISVDVRVIGATHKDLQELTKTGQFREDLFYRLNVLSITVPPLRDRLEDIPVLVRHFLEKHGASKAIKLSARALELLNGHHWPGNVRQLENETRRALVLADTVIEPEHFSPEVQLAEPQALFDGLNLRRRIDALETQLVTRALNSTDGNQTQASKLLGVSRFGLQKMMRRLGIEPPHTGSRSSS